MSLSTLWCTMHLKKSTAHVDLLAANQSLLQALLHGSQRSTTMAAIMPPDAINASGQQATLQDASPAHLPATFQWMVHNQDTNRAAPCPYVTCKYMYIAG